MGSRLFAVSCALLLSQLWCQSARADEFSALPATDPVARQLAVIAKIPASTSLTRYEAALQTARFIIKIQDRDADIVSRAQWRAVAALCASLQSELRQFGVDVEATSALAQKNLETSAAKDADASISEVSVPDVSLAGVVARQDKKPRARHRF